MPDAWETDHDEAVGVIVDAGNELLDGLATTLDDICLAAAAEADDLRAEADDIEPLDPPAAQLLREEADIVEAAAAETCEALAAGAAEEGSQMLLHMCGNPGQETIIDNALGDFVDICFQCAEDAIAELSLGLL